MCQGRKQNTHQNIYISCGNDFNLQQAKNIHAFSLHYPAFLLCRLVLYFVQRPRIIEIIGILKHYRKTNNLRLRWTNRKNFLFCCYITTTNTKNTDFINFIEKTNVKKRTQVCTQIYRRTRVLKLSVKHMKTSIKTILLSLHII